MNILDFLHKSGICESKSDARRCIKSNCISVDCKKITDDKFDISLPFFEEGDSLESMDAGTWLCNMDKVEKYWKHQHFTSEIAFIKLVNEFKTIKAITLKRFGLIGMMLENIFVVENGKRNFFIVTINYKEPEIV